jgi:hypothetical protein
MPSAAALSRSRPFGSIFLVRRRALESMPAVFPVGNLDISIIANL